jgi:hypothetical protein
MSTRAHPDLQITRELGRVALEELRPTSKLFLADIAVIPGGNHVGSIHLRVA